MTEGPGIDADEDVAHQASSSPCEMRYRSRCRRRAGLQGRADADRLTDLQAGTVVFDEHHGAAGEIGRDMGLVAEPLN